MRVLMVHVGDSVYPVDEAEKGNYVQRISLTDGKLKYFTQHNIVIADNQMQSIINEGVHVENGFLTDRKSFIALIKAGINIRKICKQNNIDLVHVLWGTSAALLTILFSPKPVVVSFCGSDLLGAKNIKGKLKISGRISRFFSQLAATFSDANIAKSEQLRSTLCFFNRNKTVVIPNGINLKGFYPIDKEVARQNLSLDQNKKYILFFYTESQIVKNKKLAEKVYSIVKDSHPESEIIYATKIPHEKLVYYYNACDVMLLTSFHEGSNNSTKEARACNLPIVSVNAGDAKERLEQVHNCFVLNWDADMLAEKILFIFSNNERSNGANFSGDVDEKFIAKRVISLYEKVLNKS